MGDSELVADSPPTEDALLIRRYVEEDDTAAFQQLVERHLPVIRRLLYTLFNGQREEMEDAEQEIVLSLFQSLRDFRFRSSFRTYFYRLARNRAIDCLRRKKSRDRGAERARLHLWNRRLETAYEPEQRFLEREQMRDLLEVFQTLSGRERQLIQMKDIDGFSMDEMAGILGVPVGTVKSRLHRARARLASRLRGAK